MHAVWNEELEDQDAAWAVIAQCVGAVILARSVKSEATRREILRANRKRVDALLQSKPGSD